MTIQLGFEAILAYLLVFVRFTGMILTNPLLSRSNIPATARTGLTLFLSLLVAPMQPAETFAMVYEMDTILYVVAALREFAIGFVYGFVFIIFYYLLFFVGDVIDQDIGLGMAKSFDPGTNIQSSFASSMITIMFAMYIFATGSHYALIKIFASSFEFIPLGEMRLGVPVATYIIELFTAAFSLVIRLMAPFVVGEFILQVSMGVLMKFVPQITVFVINFQLKIILGILMLMMFGQYIGNFVDNYIDVLFDSLVKATEVMAGTA